jgi:O-antigen/teichoic acid export membrane protein
MATDFGPGAIPSPETNQRMRAAFGLLTGSGARAGGVTLLDQAIVSAANFFAGVAVGRSCSKEEFGLYALGFSVVVFLLNIQNALIATPYTVYSPRLSGKELKSYTSSSLLHQVGYSASTAGVLFITGWLLSAGYGPVGLPPVLWALAIGIPFLLLREYSRQMSFAWLRVRSALLVDLSVAIIYLGGLYFLAQQRELSAARAFYLSGAACSLAASGWLLLTRSKFSFGSTQAFMDFRGNWELARWPLAAGLANLAAIQLYPWFLAGFHGTEATGVLSACIGTIFLANPFIIGMGNFLGPRIMHAHARGGTEAARDVVRKGTLVIFAVLGPFCLCMIFFGDFVLRAIYGGKYAGNGMVVALLTVGQFLEVITLPMVPASYVLGRPDAVFRSYFAALLVTGTAGLCLVKYFGIIGVAGGLLAAGCTASLYRWRIYRTALRTAPAGADR